MTTNNIWVVRFHQDFPVEENGETVIIADDESRASFTDRSEAVSFARKVLKNNPEIFQLEFMCMTIEEAENE